MPRSSKILLVILLSMCVLVLYQNCAPPPDIQHNPSSDKVHKFSETQNLSSDNEIVTDLQKLTIGENDEVAMGLESCKKDQGTTRNQCIYENVKKLYQHLKTKGYVVSETEGNCYLAVAKTAVSSGTPISVISTCYNDSPGRSSLHALHLDECFGHDPNLLATLRYKRSTAFEHIHANIKYEAPAIKKLQVLSQASDNSSFTDACGKSQKLSVVSLQQEVVVK